MNKLWLHLLFVLLACFGCQPTTHANSGPAIESTQVIWDKSEFNGFTDLLYAQGLFFCTFREADSHVGGTDGTIRILVSTDGISWSSAASISKDGVDLRDPKLSEMPDGQPMLTMGGSVYNEGNIVKRTPHVAFSNNGIEWSELSELDMDNEWIWRVTWFDGVGYGMAYNSNDYGSLENPWDLKLFKTVDGLHYELVKEFDIPSHPSEATLRFDSDGRMIALLRRVGNGRIGSAAPPYTDWSWNETSYRLGGPNFLILPEGDMWAATRKVVIDGDEIQTSTILANMTLTSLQEALTFPSGGDTGYPGMVYLDGKLYVSYYSTLNGKNVILFSVVKM